MEVYVAKLRGFCAGVDRAIEIVERALVKYGKPVYVRHAVVHNKFVVDNLKESGAIFVEDIKDVPRCSVLVFSAHGVPKSVRQEARLKDIKVFDATCPLVTKVHREVEANDRKGRELVMIGHHGHPEVEGTMGQIDRKVHLVESERDVDNLSFDDSSKLAFVTQTTLSVDDTSSIVSSLKNKFPLISGPKKNDICYATQNRQDGVKELAKRCNIILVVGSPNSSNSNRLREVSINHGVDSYMLDDPNQLQESWFSKDSIVGLTAGASAPEILVQRVLARLMQIGATSVTETGTNTEDVTFRIPKELDLGSRTE